MNNEHIVTINAEELSTTLALETWKVDTGNKTDKELYETILDLERGTVERQVKPEWAVAFFNLKEIFLQLIHQHRV
jgi:hypothetical protein